MSGHTPGPWRVDESDASLVSTDDDAQVRIAQIVSENCDSGAQVEADARLIAAAPDLLAALRDCVASFEAAWRDQGWNVEPNSGQVPMEELAAVNAARVVVARAEGREASEG